MIKARVVGQKKMAFKKFYSSYGLSWFLICFFKPNYNIFPNLRDHQMKNVLKPQNYTARNRKL